MISGQCNCESVGFEVSTDLDGVYICHCSICRRATGTQGNAVVVVNNTHFRWVKGQTQIATWRKPGHDWQIWFCRTCGSQLPGANSDATTFVPAGLIADEQQQLKVIHHIWVESKASWDELGASGKRHAQAYEG